MTNPPPALGGLPGLAALRAGDVEPAIAGMAGCRLAALARAWNALPDATAVPRFPAPVLPGGGSGDVTEGFAECRGRRPEVASLLRTGGVAA